MREMTVEEMKECQIKVLDKVVAFCDKHNLKYFLTGGTLIGALRHQGYIPWDDDIDISMLREDYEYLLAHKDEIDDEIVLHHFSYTDDLYIAFARAGLKGTVLKSNKITDKNNVDMHVNIDIFPIDELSGAFPKVIAKIWLLRHLAAGKIEKIKKNDSFSTKIIRLLCKLIPLKQKDFFNKIENILLEERNKKERPYAAITLSGYYFKEVVPRKVFDDTTPVIFEGKTYSAPIGYDTWLSFVFGDYMTLPPEEKRVTHHDWVAYIED